MILPGGKIIGGMGGSIYVGAYRHYGMGHLLTLNASDSDDVLEAAWRTST